MWLCVISLFFKTQHEAVSEFGKYCHLVVIKSNLGGRRKQSQVLAHYSILLLLPSYIEKFSSLIFVKKPERDWGSRGLLQTPRAAALADVAVVPVLGIFFSVLFNCRETEETHFFPNFNRQKCDSKNDLRRRLALELVTHFSPFYPKAKLLTTHLLKLVDLSDEEVSIPTSNFCVSNVDHVL